MFACFTFGNASVGTLLYRGSVFVNMAATDESVPDELSLYVGRTFTNFEDFEKLLKRRTDVLNEVLVKGSGNLSVQKANALRACFYGDI